MTIINNMKYYTGIGARSTPLETLKLMQTIGAVFAKSWILRSGGANGADAAFESGAHSVDGPTEIFLPWKGFNNNKSHLWIKDSIYTEASKIASEYHPAWHNCSQAVKKLHARNVQQILGENLDTPSQMVIAWTPNGEDVGGTATAIKLARKYNIPVYNLFGQKPSFDPKLSLYDQIWNMLECI